MTLLFWNYILENKVSFHLKKTQLFSMNNQLINRPLNQIPYSPNVLNYILEN